MFAGPQPQDRAARLRVVDKIIQDLHATHGDQIIAIGLYGSLAKGIDAPFSDIELFCVIHGANIDCSHEWVYGMNKAEVDIYSEDVIQREAFVVDEKWSLRQGQWLAARPLYGDPAFFEQLRQRVLSPSPEEFHTVMRAMLVGEFYEWIGKLRNAQSSGHTAYIPLLAAHFAEFGAQLLGMAQRTCYTTGAKMLEESLQFPNCPDGYAELCRMVMTGQLSDPAQVAAAIERCWAGLGVWVQEQGIQMDEYNRWPLGRSARS
ncbi:MAG: nucleotidyltransferase [Chloroflexi bacterium]|nr:nucleotidyltransferase [Chloroflexota bacterium]